VPAVIAGNLLFLSGHGPARPEGGFVAGKVGRDLDLEAAKHAARLTGLQPLGAMRTALGGLDDPLGCAPTSRGTIRIGEEGDR
jgi:enamine deaminase RidA (YjgF/YER057c/UK114 family)